MLTKKQRKVLEWKMKDSVGGVCFGGTPEFDALIKNGYLERLPPPVTPYAYFRITDKGREVLTEGK